MALNRFPLSPHEEDPPTALSIGPMCVKFFGIEGYKTHRYRRSFASRVVHPRAPHLSSLLPPLIVALAFPAAQSRCPTTRERPS